MFFDAQYKTGRLVQPRYIIKNTLLTIALSKSYVRMYGKHYCWRVTLEVSAGTHGNSAYHWVQIWLQTGMIYMNGDVWRHTWTIAEPCVNCCNVGALKGIFVFIAVYDVLLKSALKANLGQDMKHLKSCNCSKWSVRYCSLDLNTTFAFCGAS